MVLRIILTSHAWFCTQPNRFKFVEVTNGVAFQKPVCQTFFICGIVKYYKNTWFARTKHCCNCSLYLSLDECHTYLNHPTFLHLHHQKNRDIIWVFSDIVKIHGLHNYCFIVITVTLLGSSGIVKTWRVPGKLWVKWVKTIQCCWPAKRSKL